MDSKEDLMPDVELRLQGRLDEDSVTRLAWALDEVVSLRPEHLIVDVRRCTGLERPVLRLLGRTRASLHEQGGTLVVRGPNPTVAKALLAAGLLDRAELDHWSAPPLDDTA